jgi:DNA-binding LacI/PurR family transcriptional regulator
MSDRQRLAARRHEPEAPGDRPKTPLMSDVARRAGVSAMTVSRVLSGHQGVKPETRARVEEAIAALDYRVHTAARTLAGGRSRTLGVVSVETPYYGPSNTLFGIEAAARAVGHFLSFVTLRQVDEDEMCAALDQLRSAHVDGAVVVTPVRAAVDALRAVEARMPLVVMCGDDIPGVPTVAIDQREGARLATRHLLGLGHRTVHHVRGARTWIDANGRVAGWRQELRAHGVRAPAPLYGDWTPRSGYQAGRRLAADPEVTAVFAANDQMALGILLALAEAGRAVPDDISVVGFDDTPESAFFCPPLTTLRQDFTEVGRRCVDQLVAAIAGETVAEHVTVPPELVLRRSTADG